MSRAPCTMLPLVEARHDGRLGARETSSVERHLGACPECAAFADDLERLGALARAPDPGLSALERHRGRLRLLRESATASEPRRPRVGWPALAAALVGVAALVCLVLLFGHGSASPLVALRARVGMRAAASAPLLVTTVSPSPGAIFTRETQGNLDLVRLQTGALDISVRPLGETRRFVVRTEDAEVEVHGTRFRVEAEAGRISAVVVHQGRVSVRHRGEHELVLSGGRWEPSRPASAVGSGSEGAPQCSQEGVPALPRSEARRMSLPKDEPGLDRPGAEQSEGAASDEVSVRFRDAVRAMEQGDYGAASDRLEAFADAHPDDARAEDAAFLVVLSLDRAGRRTEAAQAASRYLAHFPHGFRRAEAEAIAARH